MGSNTFNSTANNNWTAPLNGTVMVEVWGGGGGGGANNWTGNNAGSGGGGGAYARSNVTVSKNTTYTIAIGAGGAGGNNNNNGTSGGNSHFNNNEVKAACGLRGSRIGGAANATYGAGGTVANSIGQNLYAGGNGSAKAATGLGGGGGAAAGNANAGAGGSGKTGGTGANGGGTGGNGGNAGVNGNAGSVPGGGGGGAGNGNVHVGGKGANGQIILTWTDPPVFADIRQNIIDGIISAHAETHGWNAEVKPNIPVSNVVRTSDTVVTITLPATAAYDITAAEIITATIPAIALLGGSSIVATPTVYIAPAAAGRTLKIMGVINPAKIWGIPLANIAKVIGI